MLEADFISNPKLPCSLSASLRLAPQVCGPTLQTTFCCPKKSMDGKGKDFLSHPFMFESGSFQKKTGYMCHKDPRLKLGSALWKCC